MCNCINIEFGSYDNQIELPRPPHMPSKRGINTICIDACLKGEMLHLWALGIVTTGCCCGHNKGDEYPYIGVEDKDIYIMKMMGYKVQPNKLYPERQDGFIPKSIIKY